MEVGNIGYDNLEKISAVIYKPVYNLELRMVCKLAKRDKQGKRRYAHSEFDYNVKQYIDRSKVKSIKLNFEPYLELADTSQDWNNKNTVKISYINLIELRRVLLKVKDWFISPTFKNLFFYDNNVLVKNKEMHVTETVMLSYDQSLIFTPIIININDLLFEGVQININNSICYGSITVDNLFVLIDIFDRADLFQYGLLLMNYVGRPEFDKLTYAIEQFDTVFDDSASYNDKSKTNFIDNRPKEENNVKGFFVMK